MANDNTQKQLPSLYEQHWPLLRQTAFASAVVFVATAGPGVLAWGAVAAQLVAMITMVGAGRHSEDVRERLEAVEDEVQRLAGVDPGIKAVVDWLEYGQVLQEERTEAVEARLRDLEGRVVEVEVTARDARHAAMAYAEALAADDDESARAFARAAARAIAGRTRSQIDAAALALAGRLSARGLSRLRRVYGRHWPDGTEPYHQDSAVRQGWSYQDITVHESIGSVVHNVERHRHTLEGYNWVRLTTPCARLLELTASEPGVPVEEQQ